MKWLRYQYQSCRPLGKDGRVISGSEEHIALSREAATEGMVLLKNNKQLLPFSEGTKVVLLGKAGEEYIKGGGGSGDVFCAYCRTLYEGMKIKEKEGKLAVYEGLHSFYRENIAAQYREGKEPGMTREAELSKEQWEAAAAYSDTAVFSICRFSGEDWDRKGDFYLSDEEKKTFETAKQYFRHLVVVLNVGGMIASDWFAGDEKVDAVLLAWQGGMEGGLAAADILCGDATPSGRLTDTFAAKLEDYPSTKNFHDSKDYVEYTEDIYVGYRYFETIPGQKEKVIYPFGYGLSYTEFQRRVIKEELTEEKMVCYIAVKNTGNYSGKDVLQLYFSAPQGKLGKPAVQLGAFEKTKLLQPGEETLVKLELSISDMASYDDEGKVQKSAWVLEKGDYRFYLGNSARDLTELSECYKAADDIVVEALQEHLAPAKLSKRMQADGTYRELSCGEYPEIKRPPNYDDPEKIEGIVPETRYEKRYPLNELFHPVRKQLTDVAEGKITLDEFMQDLSLEEMIWLLGGQPNTGVANTFGFGNNKARQIPNIMTADGPAGLRLLPEHEIHTTAWPCATMLACTWNRELVSRIGRAAAMEIKENNIGIWLAPGMNIHRNPMCGRNFEYYSEDPLLAGEIGAAMVQGVQSQKIAATPKHFAMNNKETNRKYSDSRVSERAAREIYLRGFERVVKKAHPWVIMSSYNLVNGFYTSENKELLTDILRGEWGFDGVVTTDWWTRAEHYREVKAGNDVKMACGYPEEVLEAVEDGRLDKADVARSARRVLELLLKFE